MAELKLTHQAIRKILNENGFEKKGEGRTQLTTKNGICYGYAKTTTGIVVRELIKGKLLQVWAHTNNPGEDIKKIGEVLSSKGYVCEVKGFMCLVELPKEA